MQTVVVQSTPIVSAAEALMEEGWNRSLDRLAEHVGEVKGAIVMVENTTENLPAVPAMKLELVPVPVSDVDRAKAFYEKAGFLLEVDTHPTDTMRVVQFTPPGSACTIVFGTGLGEITAMHPGSVKGLHLVVADISEAREALVKRGLEVGEITDVHVTFARLCS